MIKNPTLLIIGAGASAEFKLPTGPKLIEKISSRLTLYKKGGGGIYESNRDLFDALLGFAGNDVELRNRLISASVAVAGGVRMSKSIDNFVNTHSKNNEIVIVSKMAIVDCILNAEKESTLFDFVNGKTNSCDSWLEVLCPNTFADCDLEKVDSVFEGLSIIAFNYDRCIEQFLELALVRHFVIELTRARAIVEKIKIIHPYGIIGDLKNVEFGAHQRHNSLDLVKNIRTFTEGVSDRQLIDDMHKVVNQSVNIVFLGFGFLEINMKLFQGNEITRPKSIFGTAYQLSPENKSIAESTAQSIFESKNQLSLLRPMKDVGCRQFLDDFRGEFFGL
jgi:hypothetical protein